MSNYAFGQWPIPEVENGHRFEGCNFTQLYPHTKIFEGVTGLTFFKCNLTNCDIPNDAITEKCKPTHMEWCTNVRPDLIGLGFAQCVENCSHVVSTDTITIDGQVVSTTYHYEEKVVE